MRARLILVAVAVAASGFRGAVPGPRAMRVAFTATEGTFMSVDVSSDGRRLVFDLLGDIYTMPMGGGRARRLTSGSAWDREPRFTPDGRAVVFVSDRGGASNVWIHDLASGRVAARTRDTAFTFASPLPLGDGSVLARRRRDRGEPYDVSLVSIDANGHERVIQRGVMSGAARYGPNLVFADLGGVVLARSAAGVLHAIPGIAAGCGIRPVAVGTHLAIGCRREGRLSIQLVSQAGAEAETVVDSVLADPGPGVRTQESLPGFALAPSGEFLVYWKEGRLRRRDLREGRDDIIPFSADVRLDVVQPIRPLGPGAPAEPVVEWPAPAAATTGVVFVAGGTLRRAAPDGRTSPMAGAPAGGWALTPEVSPDGGRIAYSTWDQGRSSLMIAGAGEPRELLRANEPIVHPSWSPDGKYIVFARGLATPVPGVRDDADFAVAVIRADGADSSRVIAEGRGVGSARRLFTRPRFDGAGRRVRFVEHGEGVDAIREIDLSTGSGRRTMRLPPTEDAIVSAGGAVAMIAGGRLRVTPATVEGSGAAIDLGAAEHVAWAGETLVGCVPGTCRRYSGRRFSRVEVVSVGALPADGGGDVALTGARILTLSAQGTILDGTIIVRGGRIRAVGPSSQVVVPAGLPRIDLAGATVMPGLIDAHTHMLNAPPETAGQAAWKLEAYLAAGVTTVFDAQSMMGVFALGEAIAAGRLAGPRIVSAGEPLYGGSGYERLNGPVVTPLASAADADSAVARRVRAGARLIKVYREERRDRRQRIAAAAARQSVGVTAEGACDFALAMTLMVDGYTVEHAIPGRPYADVLALVGATRASYTPTLSTACGGRGTGLAFARSSAEVTAWVERYLPAPVRRALGRPGGGEGWPRFQALAADAAVLSAAGACVCASSHGEAPGIGLHWEVRALADAGMSHEDAIAAATRCPAEKLGLSADLGSVEVGKVADLLVVNGDPLRDLAALDRVRLVLKAGVVRFSAQPGTDGGAVPR